MPGGRPILFPFNLAILMPSLVLSLRLLISISANIPASLKKTSPIIVEVLIPSVRDIIITHFLLSISITSHKSFADLPILSIFQTMIVSPAEDCFISFLRMGRSFFVHFFFQ